MICFNFKYSRWAKTMSNELGSYGITVNNVLPGSTATERLFSIAKDRIEMTGQSEEKVMDDMEKIIPLGRFGKPEEIAWAVAFIASPAASYINGINFPVDGGKTKSL
jgi:3-oxoacyl-[acyl-carrier protein] reductase